MKSGAMKLFLGVGVAMAAVLAACSSDSSSNTGSPAVVGGDAGSAGSSAGSAGSSNAGAGGSTAGAGGGTAGTGTTGGSGGGNTFGGGGSSGSGTAGKGGSGTGGSGTGGSGTGGSGTDCSTMPAQACYQCCDDASNQGFSKANTMVVNDCGCAKASKCESACQKTCTAMMLDQPCVDCLNGLAQTEACIQGVISKCQKDPDCVAGVTCGNKCPQLARADATPNGRVPHPGARPSSFVRVASREEGLRAYPRACENAFTVAATRLPFPGALSRPSETLMSDTSDPERDLLPLFRQMQLIRRVEEECARAYAQGKIGGFLHLYIGQEAIAVAAHAALRATDYALTTYRDHGLALARGMSPRTLLAELFGKDAGCSRGLGGSMHLFDVEHRMLGGYGIVGGHIPLGAGVAFASKYRGDGGVTMCFFGEGAVPIGDFHEALHLAALWKLPVVFVCENNEFAMGTPLSRTLPVSDITARAAGYGVASDRFDVVDVLDVKLAFARAVERAREESLPTLIEAHTYRFRGHSMSDPGKYRTPEEVEEHKRRDPLLRARTTLVSALGEPRVLAVEAEIDAEVKDAIAFADAAPPPALELLEATTYKGPFAR